MSRKGGKVVGIGIRRPSPPVDEAAIAALEGKAEAMGNGVAGQSEPAAAAAAAAPAPEPQPVPVVRSVPVDLEPPTGSRGIIQRTGRLRADGSRTDARTLRRLTVYLPPQMAKAVERRAVETGLTKSEATQAALAQWLSAQD